MRSTELLQHFFGAYFHQDWSLDDPDWRSVVRRYRNDGGGSNAKVVAKDIRALVAEAPSERALEQHLLYELGCYYSFRPDLGGPSTSARLEEVSGALEEFELLGPTTRSAGRPCAVRQGSIAHFVCSAP